MTTQTLTIPSWNKFEDVWNEKFFQKKTQLITDGSPANIFSKVFIFPVNFF